MVFIYIGGDNFSSLERKKVLLGQFEFDHLVWETVSEEGKNKK